jgi:2-C-methyl-D-erythritol 2,4-cyclodiphosphate synthase
MYSDLRVGFGLDFHRYDPSGKPLKLGGILIKCPEKVSAHSDGDCLIHATIDALLGGAAKGDIGELFSDQDHSYENASSIDLLKTVVNNELIGYQIINLDVTIVAQYPKLSSYKGLIKQNMESLLKVPVSVKATTTEKMGFIGSGQGIACFATVLLIKNQR